MSDVVASYPLVDDQGDLDVGAMLSLPIDQAPADLMGAASFAAPPPYEYAFDFDTGMGPWTTWMAPSVVTEIGGEHESFTRLNAPGWYDPNHLEGVGALRLVAHLSIPTVGSPGVLNLENAEFEITVRATDFQANNGKLVVWLCTYVPEEGIYKNYYVGLVATNWANTGNDMVPSLVEGEWVTVTVRLSNDLDDWTYGGENHFLQGDNADRYQPLDLGYTMQNTNATLHLVMINDELNDYPTGFLDIANITVRTQEPARPVGAAGDNPSREIFYGLEDQLTTGNLAGDGIVDLSNATFSVVAGSATNGTVTLDPSTGAFVWTPNPDHFGPTDYVGAATFRYTVTDGVNTSSERTAFIFIGPVNDAPTASASVEAIQIAADEAFAFTLLQGADVDRDERLTFELVDGSTVNGTVTLDAATGRYVFTPTAGFSGTASFSYVVTDGQLDSAPKTVTLTVTPPSVTPIRSTYAEAVDALERGDTERWVRGVMQAAEDGDVNAAHHYGIWLLYGQNVTSDPARAAYFLEKAQADPYIKLLLVDMYASGNGVPRDYAQARTLLNELPDNAAALYKLAIMNDRGLAGPEDDVRAGELYLQAAKLGNGDAMFSIGRRYLSGEGVAVSAAEAYFWLGAARKFGFTQSNTDQFDRLVVFNMNQAAALGLSPEDTARLDAQIAAWTVGQQPPVGGQEIIGEGVLVGTAYNDVIKGGSGRDVLIGHDGDDILYGGSGAPDELYGGRGDDTYVVESAGDTIVELAGEGVDTVQTGLNAYTLAAHLENLIYTGVGNFIGTGNAENNVITGGAGDDILDGGAGEDAAVFSGSRADYTITTINGVTTVVGPDGRDTLMNIEMLKFSDGRYSIAGEPLIELIEGTSGDDVLIGTDGFDLLIGRDGNDVLKGGLGRDTLVGGAGDDILWGGSGVPNELLGGLGDDYYVVEAKDTVVEFAGEGIDTVEARINDYTLSANVENLVFGGTGNFTGTGNAEDNIITGGRGDDILSGRGGNDVLNGGAGMDTADYSLAASGVTARLDQMRATNDGDGGTDTFISIEAIIGSAFDDLLIGGAGNDVLKGGLGRDTLLGGAGDDILWGGAGDPNQLQGGLGDDYYVVEAKDTVVEFAGEGIDTVEARINAYTLSANVENLVFGGTGNFTGTGNAGDNIIIGGAGDDLLIGGAGNDVLKGGLGRDTLLGGAGDDILWGGEGVPNQLQGGLGDDYYVLEANDTVVEFVGEGIDTVEARINAYTLSANVENLVFGGTGNFTGMGNAGDNIITGGAGDDILQGMGGNDVLNGGDGLDEARFRGAKADYTVTAEGSGYRVVDSVAGRDGTTLVTSIETLRFMTGDTTTALTYPVAGAAAAADMALFALSIPEDDAFIPSTPSYGGGPLGALGLETSLDGGAWSLDAGMTGGLAGLFDSPLVKPEWGAAMTFDDFHLLAVAHDPWG